jgi:hypothetical protein
MKWKASSRSNADGIGFSEIEDLDLRENTLMLA